MATKSEILEAQEVLRIHHIIEIARRDNKPIAAELSKMGASKALAQQYIDAEEMALPEVKKHTTDKDVGRWVEEHAGELVTVDDVATGFGVSQGTAYKIINGYLLDFVKESRGKYRIHNSRAERLLAKKVDAEKQA